MKSLIFYANPLKVVITNGLSNISHSVYHNKFITPIKYVHTKHDRLPTQHHIKVRNIQTGICGTDILMYTARQGPSTALMNMPGTEMNYMGHETVGIVEEVGSKVKKFKKGDRVNLMRYLPCCANKDLPKPCKNCLEGNYASCENYGVRTPIKQLTGAGMGDYYYATEEQIIKTDEHLTNDEAVLVEPLSVGLHAVLKCPPKDGDKVLVIGTGMIGLGIVQCAKVVNKNCKVYVMGHGDKRNDFAKKLGADGVLEGEPYKAVAKTTGGKLYGWGPNKMVMGGFDIIYDTVGKKRMFNDSLRWLKSYGTLVKVGCQLTKTHFDETPIWWQGLHIIGVDSHGMENWNGRKAFTFELVMELIRDGKLKTDGFITHRFKLDDYKEAFKMILEHRRDTIKVVLDCS